MTILSTNAREPAAKPQFDRIGKHRALFAKAYGCDPGEVEAHMARDDKNRKWLNDRIEYLGRDNL